MALATRHSAGMHAVLPPSSFCPITHAPLPRPSAAAAAAGSGTDSLPRPLALRCETRLDRADPVGTHFSEDAPAPRKLPRPRAHLRSRSYGDAELRAGARAPACLGADGPKSLAPEALRPVSSAVVSFRSISPASNLSFGSAVTADLARSASSDWSEADEASARAHLSAAVASATGRDLSSSSSPTVSDLSADVRGLGSAGSTASSGWGRRRTARTLSLSLTPTEPPLQPPNAPASCLSHPNLKYARCACGNVRYPANSAQLTREFARSLPRGCSCREEPPMPRFAPPSRSAASGPVPAKQPSPDRRLLRFIKKRLNWANRTRK